MIQMTPKYSTMLFTDIWNNSDDFLEDYYNNGISPMCSRGRVELLFYLLYARYGNSPIANYDITQFKYKLFSIIFQYGPTWEKRLEIQTIFRNMNENDLIAGGKAIYNNALNPQTEPTTNTLEELNYINSQNTTNYKKSKLEAYSLLWDSLSTDVTEAFIKKFNNLFLTVVSDQRPLLYITGDDTENNDEEYGPSFNI